MAPRTLFEKVWDAHVVHQETGQEAVLYVDLHLVHEVTSPQAFDALRAAGRCVRRPELTIATADHNVPTSDRTLPLADDIARRQLEALSINCAEFGVTLYDMLSPNQGIVHVIGPEQGYTQPGQVIVCGDSHTSTHGAFGAFALGIFANAFTRIANQPATIVAMHGLIVLVPGSKTYIGLNSFMTGQDFVKADHLGQEVFLIFMSLVAGLIFANVVMPTKKAL